MLCILKYSKSRSHYKYACPFLLAVPNAIKYLVIPNPIADNVKFFNDVLTQLYCEIYTAISPLQFKEYVSAQQIHRWRQVSKRKDHERTFNDLNSSDSKNGNSINVNKYSKDNVNFTSCDVSRAENTKEHLTTVLEKFEAHRENLLALRAQLFNANSILKKIWKANELKFYDKEISCYANMIKIMSEKLDEVTATSVLLRRRFFFKDVDEAKERLSKKRKKENKKAEKRLKLRSSEAVVKLIRLIAPERSENLSDQELISPDYFNI